MPYKKSFSEGLGTGDLPETLYGCPKEIGSC